MNNDKKDNSEKYDGIVPVPILALGLALAIIFAVVGTLYMMYSVVGAVLALPAWILVVWILVVKK